MFVVTETAYQADGEMPPHHDPVSHLSFVLGGSLTEIAGRQCNSCVTCSLVTKPAGVVHSNAIGRTGARVLKIQFENDAGWQDCKLAGATHYRWYHSGLHTSLAFQVYREFLTDDSYSNLAIESLCLELFEVVEYMNDNVTSGEHPMWLERCVEALHEEFNTPVRLDSLAAEAGVHPVYLARAFRRRFRCSIGEYIRRLRIETAAREVSSSSQPLCQIALGAGFSDQAHFTRVFKKHTGFTPGQYRCECGGH